MTHTVKLAERAARRMLQNESCRVIIDKASSTFVFVTEPGIFEHDGELSVSIPEERIIVPITDITKIELPVSRFTPDKMCFMEIAWSDSPASGTQSPEATDERQ